MFNYTRENFPEMCTPLPDASVISSGGRLYSSTTQYSEDKSYSFAFLLAVAQPTVFTYTQRVPPPLTEHGSKRARGHRMKVLHPVKCFPKAQPRFDLCCYKAMDYSVLAPYRTLRWFGAVLQ